MKATHTPGPWKAEPNTNPGECFNIYSDVNRPICAIYAADGEYFDGPSKGAYCLEDNANKRLILAAPDLADLLIAALPFIEVAAGDPLYKQGVAADLERKIRTTLKSAGLI